MGATDPSLPERAHEIAPAQLAQLDQHPTIRGRSEAEFQVLERLTNEIRQANEQLILAVLGALEEDQLAPEAGQAASMDGVHDLAAQVQQVTRRLSRAVAHEWLGASRDPGAAFQPLTGREREVLQLLAEGYSNKEIGVVLDISTKTVETHRARIMKKLRVHSMNALVRYAIRNGMIQV
jgi:DNA-binding NarL/FixJ family response regulator